MLRSKGVRLLLSLAALSLSRANEKEETRRESHDREKRVIWMTNDGRIALPPGTVMTITPTLALPFVRYPPSGFLSNMTISLPFTSKSTIITSQLAIIILLNAIASNLTVDFDKLGLTDNENPYGALPSVFDRGMKSRQAGMLMADFIASFIKRRIHKRQIQDAPKNAFHGGERALLYATAEDMLSTLGLDGKACLLRAICEVQGHPLNNFGLIGEMLKLFFT